ncbi:phosphotransferase [Actinomadura gamaensis]|uniref:Phosphotransferase n=1 Tax=Actinomadura gamaensis TaxID=1763541 RepID=A0ABV9U8V6_9ACTN
MGDELSRDLQEALRQVAERCGADLADAKIVHQHSNTAIALPTARLLVRVAGTPDSLDRVATSVHVTRWLAHRGYRCVEPVDLDPFTAAGHVISVWRLLDTVDRPSGTARELADLLRTLHEQPQPSVGLPSLDDPFASVAAAVARQRDGLDDHDREWLLTRIAELRRGWADVRPARPKGLIHGDAHTNNLIRLAAGGVVLGDWDHVAWGPREWDLIQPHYMARRFGRHTAEDLDDFTTAYGWDVREWSGFEQLLQTREITGLSPYVRKAADDDWSRDELKRRVATLRGGDSLARWSSPSG